VQSLLDRKDDMKNQIRVCEMLGQCPDVCLDNSKKQFVLKAVFGVCMFVIKAYFFCLNNYKLLNSK